MMRTTWWSRPATVKSWMRSSKGAPTSTVLSGAWMALRRTLKAMRTLAAKNDHASRSVINAACGGLWMNDRRARAFDEDSTCAFCQEGFGTPHHVVFECPAFAQQRKEAKVGLYLEDVPACVQTFGLGIQFPEKLAPTEEISAGTTTY
eukprot:5526228-Amphidinium_carterae.1